MKFNNLSGTINHVPIATYEKLISLYVNNISILPGVKSIIQIGSFTVPGLSDIDIIVIVDDLNPPTWEEISIKKILKGQEGFEVIVHDVFIYPEKLAQYIEGLFYLDRKIVLYGKDIGSVLPNEKVEELKLILAYEYTIHRLESLIILTSLKSTKLRDVLLFISTLRHTYVLLCSFDIISENESKKRIYEIETLRREAINKNDDQYRININKWANYCYTALFESSILLANKLKYNSEKSQNKWVLNCKKLIIERNNSVQALKTFQRFEKLNNFFKGKIIIETLPNNVRQHIRNYETISTDEIELSDQLNSFILRNILVKKHTQFIRGNKYRIPSSYIIIDKRKLSFQDRIKNIFLRIIIGLNLIK